MGYYSKIAVAMKSEHYTAIFKKIENHTYKQELLAFLHAADKLIMKGAEIKPFEADFVKTNKDDIIILHWENYKHWHVVAEDEFMMNWCIEHNSDYIRVGEDPNDIVINTCMDILSIGETTIDWQAGDTQYSLQRILRKIVSRCGGINAMTQKYGIDSENLLWLKLQKKEYQEAKNTFPIDDNSDKMEFIGHIIDIFEDFLDENNVKMPKPKCDLPNEHDVKIYGKHYEILQNKLDDLLKNWQISL